MRNITALACGILLAGTAIPVAAETFPPRPAAPLVVEQVLAAAPVPVTQAFRDRLNDPRWGDDDDDDGRGRDRDDDDD
ncbi:hypothetical protein ACLBXM_17675 [Xanthobacteraceae bacterium A53D]